MPNQHSFSAPARTVAREWAPVIEVAAGASKSLTESNIVCVLAASCIRPSFLRNDEAEMNEMLEYVREPVSQLLRARNLDAPEAYGLSRISVYVSAMLPDSTPGLGECFYACAHCARSDIEYADVSLDAESLEGMSAMSMLSDAARQQLKRVQEDPSLPTYPANPHIQVALTLQLMEAIQHFQEAL